MSFVSKDWSQEDVKLLTLSIVKFPPGTVNRWAVIADYCGKTQKQVIGKAKEIQEKKQRDLELKRE
jgi:hypothetical protein